MNILSNPQNRKGWSLSSFNGWTIFVGCVVEECRRHGKTVAGGATPGIRMLREQRSPSGAKETFERSELRGVRLMRSGKRLQRLVARWFARCRRGLGRCGSVFDTLGVKSLLKYRDGLEPRVAPGATIFRASGTPHFATGVAVIGDSDTLHPASPVTAIGASATSYLGTRTTAFRGFGVLYSESSITAFSPFRNLLTKIL